MVKSEQEDAGGAEWCTLFEERHGVGAYERLLTELRQPCVTFAAIAKRLGVTRERVRQWQMVLLPDAPRGHERQRLCAASQRKRQLFKDRLFRGFYRHARSHMNSERIELIATTGGYRRRMVRIDRRIIALRSARPCDATRISTAPLSTALEYRLTTYDGIADFVYYRLAADEFLLIPAHPLRNGEVRFVDESGAPYSDCKNTFAALDDVAASPEPQRWSTHVD